MSARFFALCFLSLGTATSASAQVTYRHNDGRSYESIPAAPHGADDDLSYATHPSFQIFDTPYGPRTRVIYRCAYPNGWNATDFIRDMNGTPTGIGHTCAEAPSVERRTRARY